MVAEARDLRNRTLADLMARRRDLRVQLEELRAGKDSLSASSMPSRPRSTRCASGLFRLRTKRRVAAEQAGEALERQPGHDELSELEEELAAAGRVLDEGAGAVVETVETIETVEVGAPEGGQLLGEDVPVKGGTSSESPQRRRAFRPYPGQPGRRRGGPKATSRRASDTRGGRDASWASSRSPRARRRTRRRTGEGCGRHRRSRRKRRTERRDGRRGRRDRGRHDRR